MKLSKNSNKLIGQAMFGIKVKAEALEREGKDLIHFEIGDNYFDAPKQVKKACIKAIKQNKTHYTDPKGLYQLRETIAEKYDVEIENVVIVPANFGIFAALSVLCNKGDKINYPNPGFPTYKAVANYLGLKKGKGKVTISCYPNNPDGKPHIHFEGFTIHDLPYLNMFYDPENLEWSEYLFEVPSPKLNFKENLFIFSFSKSHAMSGFRLGYILADKEIIDKIGLLIETTYSCLPEFIQIAGLEALKVKRYKLKELKERRDLMVKLINENPLLKCETPKGGIYCWAKTIGNYFEHALERGVVVCPGEVFGKKGYVRFCFARSIEEIKEGFRRLE
jgi:aspartate aminotransferase